MNRIEFSMILAGPHRPMSLPRLEEQVAEIAKLVRESAGGRRGRGGSTLAREIYAARAQAAVRATQGSDRLPATRAKACELRCEHPDVEGVDSCAELGGCLALIGGRRNLIINRRTRGGSR